jgi:hypothetical protein
VDLDTFIVATYCLVDDHLQHEPTLRQRGPRPALADAEVVTMEIVGEFLGLATDTALVAYFRQHYGHFFPALRRIHRTTFVRQAANLWVVKARLWQVFVRRIPHDPHVALIDSFPIPVCRFARAPRCRLFRSDAAFGYDVAAQQTFFGFRCHIRVCWPGVITDVLVAPADISEPVIARELARDTVGYLVGDRT